MAGDFTITIQGIEALAAKFNRLEQNQILIPPMERSVVRLQNFMAKYPSPPPNSKYRRTGTLGRRWTTKVTESSVGVEGRVGNNTIYAPLVQSAALQTPVHRGRWQTDQDAIRRNKPAIIRDFEQAIARALK